MTSNSTSNFSSIFRDGKLQPGIYKIQNLYTETYLDIELHSRGVCCRPAKSIGEGRGLVRWCPSSVAYTSDNSKWEIKWLGPGYTVQRFDPGEPEQFCTPLDGLQNGATLRVGTYPVAWRVEVVNDDDYRGFGYVRFYWAMKKIAWDVEGGCKDDGAKVVAYRETANPWQVWRLLPTKVEGAFTPLRSSFETPEPGSLPSYVGDSGQPSTYAQHAESERNEFGTIVNEVTVVTTTSTVTTRKKYRVEDD